MKGKGEKKGRKVRGLRLRGKYEGKLREEKVEGKKVEGSVWGWLWIGGEI